MSGVLLWMIILALVPAALYGLFLVIAALVGLGFWIVTGICILVMLRKKDPPDNGYPEKWGH